MQTFPNNEYGGNRVSFSYYLYLTALQPAETLLAGVAELCGETVAAGVVNVSGMQISACAVDADEAELSLQAYGFCPEVSVSFRHHGSGTEVSTTDAQTFGIVASVLARYCGSAVLETQCPVTVLLRRGGKVWLNRRCGAAHFAAAAFPNASWADLPEL